MKDSQRLEEIRKRFIGSGEEHELLARLSEGYSQAYERGYADRSQEQADAAAADADAVKFARLLDSLNYSVRRFLFWDSYHEIGGGDDYELKTTAQWCVSIGRTPEQLRKLADEMERIAAVPCEA